MKIGDIIQLKNDSYQTNRYVILDIIGTSVLYIEATKKSKRYTYKYPFAITVDKVLPEFI